MSPTNSVLRFAKLSENAFPPLKGSAYAAGWDLRRSVYIFFSRHLKVKYLLNNDVFLVLLIMCYQHEEN